MSRRKKSPHVGSSLESFLEEEQIVLTEAAWNRFVAQLPDAFTRCSILNEPEAGSPLRPSADYEPPPRHAGRTQIVGRVDHASSIQVPAAMSSAPLTRALWAPSGATFSNATKTVSAKMTARFITPPAKSSSISAQQQPRQ